MFNPLSQNELTDTHCHLNDSSFDDDRDEVVERAAEEGIEKIVDIAVDLKTSQKALNDSDKYPNIVFPSAGIDMEMFVPGSDLFEEEIFSKPQIEIGNWINDAMRRLDELLSIGKFVMVGECGMDYYWLSQNKKISEEDKKKSKLIQKLLFSSQIELAIKYDLPLSIHSRGAEEECIKIVETFKNQLKGKANLFGSFHSFTGTAEQAKSIVELGFRVGVNGIVTYAKAKNVREVVRAAGRESIVYETDAPYLIPSGAQVLKKGRNEPASTAEIKRFIERMNLRN